MEEAMFLKYLSILAISVVAAGHASAASYDVVVLQDLGGVGESQAVAINNSAQIAGFSSTNVSDGFLAVQWSASPGTGTALQDVGGQGFSVAFGINASGQVVGYSNAVAPVHNAIV
jgi:uncharacterized membrane protein